jgi:hypothetical protein
MKHPWWLVLLPGVVGGLVSLALTVSGCKGDFPELTRGMSYYDGTKVITLEQGQKLVNVTWKKDVAWYLVRPMRPGELPERYEFHEDSLLEGAHGQVVIQEKAAAFP